MRQEEVKNLNFNAFSIIELENKQKVLILLCESISNANNLYELLKLGKYKLTVGVTNQRKYKFEIDFFHEGFALQFDTNLTAENYPPLLWFANSSVSLITTGIKGEGQNRYWNENYLSLQRPSLN